MHVKRRLHFHATILPPTHFCTPGLQTARGWCRPNSAVQQEVFLRFSYVQPALRATQPSRVRLKIAPIDVIYSQARPSMLAIRTAG